MVILSASNTLGFIGGIDGHAGTFFAFSASSKEGNDHIFVTPDFSYKRPVAVAVLPFSNDTGDESLDWLSNGIPENSIPKFTASKHIRLIDRGLIKEILDQLGLSTSDLADPENALRVGRLATAQIIVRGSYQKRQGDILKIIGRFTDVETGTIFRAVEENGSWKNMDDLMERISHALVLAIDPNVPLEIRLVPKSRSRSKAALKSMIWPGWGDLPDRKVSAVLMGVLQLGVLAGAAICQFDYARNLDEYKAAREKYGDAGNFSSYSEYKAQRELMLSKHKDTVDSRKLRNVLFLSAVVGTRIIGALESALFTPRASDRSYSFVPDTENGAVTLSWRHKF